MENKLNVLEVMDAIRNRIFAGEFASMREINHECRTYFDRLKTYEYDWLRADMFAAYIIWCEVQERVPVSGYGGGDNDLTVDEMVKGLIDRIASVIMRRKGHEKGN